MLHKMRHEPVLFTVMWVSSVFLPKTNMITLCAWISIHFDGTVLVGGCTWLSVRLSTPEDDKRKWNRPCSVARASRLTYDVSCCCHSHRSHRRSQIFISRYIREYGCNQCLATVYFPASHRSFFSRCGFFFESIVELSHKSEHVTWHRSHGIAIVLARIQSPSLQRCQYSLGVFFFSSNKVRPMCGVYLDSQLPPNRLWRISQFSHSIYVEALMLVIAWVFLLSRVRVIRAQWQLAVFVDSRISSEGGRLIKAPKMPNFLLSHRHHACHVPCAQVNNDYIFQHEKCISTFHTNDSVTLL